VSNPQASPVSVDINGNDYRMSPLTDRNIGEINNYIRSNLIKAARESLTDDTPQNLVDTTLRVAMKEAQKLDWMRDAELIQSPEVLLYVFWLSFQKESPCTKDELATDLFTDMDALDRCMDSFMLIQPLMGNRKAARKPQRKTAKKKSQ